MADTLCSFPAVTNAVCNEDLNEMCCRVLRSMVHSAGKKMLKKIQGIRLELVSKTLTIYKIVA